MSRRRRRPVVQIGDNPIMPDDARSLLLRSKRLAVRLLPPILTEALRVAFAKRRAQPEPAPPTQEAILSATDITEPEPSAAPPPPPDPELAPPPEWEIVPDTADTWDGLGGWDHQSIVATQRAKWPDFLKTVEGPGLMGRSHEAINAMPDLATHNTIISFGYALGRVCTPGRTVSMLDWGGGLGHYCLYARALFPEQDFEFHIKDLPGLCAAGAELLPDVTFHADDATALARSYDFVLASSAVHYARDPYAKMLELCAAARQRILITRTPVLDVGTDVLVVQRPHRYGYLTEYAGWVMNRQRLVDSVEANGFVLERQFLIGEQPYLPDMEEQAQYYGFLFRKR